MTRLLLWGYPLCTITNTLLLFTSSIAATKLVINLSCNKPCCELQYAITLNSVTWCQMQLGTVKFNNWSPLIAWQTRLCGVEISFLSHSHDFFSSPLQVTYHPSAFTQLSSRSKAVLKWYSTTFIRALYSILHLLFKHFFWRYWMGVLFWSATHLCAEGLYIYLFLGQCESWSGILIESSLFIDIDYLFSKSFQHHREDLQRSSYCITACSIHKTFTHHLAEQ